LTYIQMYASRCQLSLCTTSEL